MSKSDIKQVPLTLVELEILGKLVENERQKITSMIETNQAETLANQLRTDYITKLDDLIRKIITKIA